MVIRLLIIFGIILTDTRTIESVLCYTSEIRINLFLARRSLHVNLVNFFYC